MNDDKYLKERVGVAARIGRSNLWDVVDHWPLYVGVRNLARYLAIYEIIKEFAPIPGDIAEFASWRGSNLMFMTKLQTIMDPQSARRIHCFDSFQGLATFAKEDGKQSAGQYRGSREELEAMIRLYELDGKVTINQGNIESTFPKFLVENPGLHFSLLYFDADLYSPAVAALKHGHDRLVKGGAFVFDEWNFLNFPGESTAVREFMSAHGDS